MLLKASEFSSVEAGKLASLNLDEFRNLTIMAIGIQLTNCTKAQVEDFQIKLGSRQIVQPISGSQLQKLNDYENLGDEATVLWFYFGDPTAKTAYGQFLTALDYAYYRGKVLNLKARPAAGTTNPDFTVWVDVYDPKQAMGLEFTEAEIATTRAMLYTQLTPSTAVTRQAQQISLGNEAGARLRKLAFLGNTVNSVELKKNGSVQHEDVPQVVLDSYLEDFTKVKQTDLYMIDYVKDGNAALADKTTDANDSPYPYNVLLSTSGAGQVDVFADVRAPLGLL